tara:strand:- start:581 stop:763 length:183 start_codon:yes stop_codon:yes gene_type:complete
MNKTPEQLEAYLAEAEIAAEAALRDWNDDRAWTAARRYARDLARVESLEAEITKLEQDND